MSYQPFCGSQTTTCINSTLAEQPKQKEHETQNGNRTAPTKKESYCSHTYDCRNNGGHNDKNDSHGHASVESACKAEDFNYWCDSDDEPASDNEKSDDEMAHKADDPEIDSSSDYESYDESYGSDYTSNPDDWDSYDSANDDDWS
jgi:hypothetical protein